MGLDDSALTNGLGVWNYGGGSAPADFGNRLQAHPRFAQAVRALAANMLAASATDHALDGIFKDAGRYGVTFIAMHLHLHGGLTLPRLKAMAVGSSLSSPGRARAVMLYLRYLGFITRAPHEQGRPQRFLPTDRCMELWRGHLEAALAAAAIIEPEAWHIHGSLASPVIYSAFAARHSENLFSSFAESEKLDSPFFRIFMHRSAGSQILWSLILEDESDSFPPLRTRQLSLPAMAQRFGVSRVHVRRMFEAAEAAGLLHQEGEIIVFHEECRRFMAYLFSTQMLWLLDAAASALPYQRI